jgi:hypothetical protein
MELNVSIRHGREMSQQNQPGVKRRERGRHWAAIAREPRPRGGLQSARRAKALVFSAAGSPRPARAKNGRESEMISVRGESHFSFKFQRASKVYTIALREKDVVPTITIE